MVCSSSRQNGFGLCAINNNTRAIHAVSPGRHLYKFILCLFAAFPVFGSVFAAADTEFPHIPYPPESTNESTGDSKRTGMQDVYTPAQGQAFLEQANDQATRGNYSEALKQYGNALQVVRIAEGLNSLNQLPILQAQLKLLEKTRQWQRYDETLTLVYTLSQDQLPAGDDRRIQALNQLAKWKFKATEEELLEDLSRDSAHMVERYEEELRLIEHSGITNIADFTFSSLKLGEAYARLSQLSNTIKKPLGEYRSVTSRPTMERTPCRTTTVRGDRGDPQQACMQAPGPNLDYYRVPQRKKDQEVRKQLEALRISILDAAKTLEEKPDFPDRDLLVEEFRFLAESFTEIVSQ
jgi:hypothetical protein